MGPTDASTDDTPLGFAAPLRADLAADTPPEPPSEPEREETAR
jgi:hypothetical protein